MSVAVTVTVCAPANPALLTEMFPVAPLMNNDPVNVGDETVSDVIEPLSFGGAEGVMTVEVPAPTDKFVYVPSVGGTLAGTFTSTFIVVSNSPSLTVNVATLSPVVAEQAA